LVEQQGDERGFYQYGERYDTGGEHGEGVIDGNMKSVEYTDRLPIIKITPIFVGERDECDVAVSKATKRFPTLSWAIMSNGGRKAFVDQPKLYGQAVDEFLEENLNHTPGCCMMKSLRRALLVALLTGWATMFVFAQQPRTSLAIVTESLPQPAVHQPYQVQLQATGGIPPMHWKVSGGKLPDGLTLDEEGGIVFGVPTRLSEAEFTVSLTDSAGNTISRNFTMKVAGTLLIEWSHFPLVEGNQIAGSVKVANGTRDPFDLTVIVLGVNEYGKAFALGYQHFDLKPETAEVEIPFGSSLPQGAYVIHADAIAEIAAKNTIYRARQQTPSPLQVTTGP